MGRAIVVMKIQGNRIPLAALQIDFAFGHKTRLRIKLPNLKALANRQHRAIVGIHVKSVGTRHRGLHLARPAYGKIVTIHVEHWPLHAPVKIHHLIDSIHRFPLEARAAKICAHEPGALAGQ